MILLVSFGGKPISSSSFRIHRTSTKHLVIPLNSSSTLERATTFCFLLLQVTRFPPTRVK
ncbi:hypothetical protein Hanom_Chr01g00063321 [Helianthus anomalus]